MALFNFFFPCSTGIKPLTSIFVLIFVLWGTHSSAWVLFLSFWSESFLAASGAIWVQGIKSRSTLCKTCYIIALVLEAKSWSVLLRVSRMYLYYRFSIQVFSHFELHNWLDCTPFAFIFVCIYYFNIIYFSFLHFVLLIYHKWSLPWCEILILDSQFNSIDLYLLFSFWGHIHLCSGVSTRITTVNYQRTKGNTRDQTCVGHL